MHVHLKLVWFYIFITGKAQQTLTENGLEAMDGCMKTIVDMYTGEIYRIPNYCICEPTFVKKFEDTADTVAELLNVTSLSFNLVKNVRLLWE